MTNHNKSQDNNVFTNFQNVKISSAKMNSVKGGVILEEIISG